MKFAKELDRDLVPEWRLKYLNYKIGKKKLKAINRALRNVDSTPRLRRRGTNVLPSPFDAAPKYSFINREHAGQGETASSRDPEDLRTLAITNSRDSLQKKASNGRFARTPEETPLTESQGLGTGHGSNYGSFVATPKERKSAGTGKKSIERSRAPPSLKLPGAALDPETTSPHAGPSDAPSRKQKSVQFPAVPPETDNAFEVGKTVSPKKQHSSLPARYRSIFTPKRMNSLPGSMTKTDSRPSIRRIFSMSNQSPLASPGDVPLEAYRDLDLRQAEFFTFLDAELDKIESFYKQKEDEATQRLDVLRDQLHIMRDRRIDDIINRQAAKIKTKPARPNGHHLLSNDHPSSSGEVTPHEDAPNGKVMNKSWMNPIDAALEAINQGKYGKNTKNITQLATPSGLNPQDYLDNKRDFARRPELPHVPYSVAKRKLKVALQEYYRGLELLKSYALLNRTAFRKINKKYDKTVNARPTMRYMTEKVNQAWFVNSDVIEGHIRATEDLYARYFERGNHKVAVGKLRIKIARAGDYTDNTFRNGILLTAGFILGVQGLIRATEVADLRNLPDKFSINTSYLLQLYAGYFLVNFLLLLFCLACRVWHETKINYVFIFEYDTRHYLDWRQLAELPCWCFFMLGLFMQLNFEQVGGESVYLYYPVILIALSVALLVNPIKMIYYRTRMWLLYSLWRLVLAGLYPVEWRDFYLGDMFCSLTYSMGNIALFFCLYSRDWDNPPSCNSSSLRVLGFLTTLPGIWRALQCIRRYRDTRNVFPHLLNCGKYFATILFYTTLSVYRINKTSSTYAAFITFATLNSIYTSFWDIYYDWSLGDPRAPRRFLRKELGYKKIWWYYAAMIIDPILRFNWVMYTILPLQIQHSAVTSFCVSVSEILRRGMWSLFRVENEHCTNVGRFRASRDVPLPYYVPPSPDTEPEHPQTPTLDEEQRPPSGRGETGRVPSATHASSTSLDLERTQSSARSRRSGQAGYQPSPIQRAFTNVGDMFRGAHAQDFERKKKPELGRDPRDTKMVEDDTDDDTDGEEEVSRDASGNEADGDRNIDSDDEEVPDDEEESALSRIREDVSIGMSGGAGGRPEDV